MANPQKPIFTLEDIFGIGNVPAYLTPKNIAEILQIGESTARRRCAEKKYRGAFKLEEDNEHSPYRVRSRLFEQQLREAEEKGEMAA